MSQPISDRGGAPSWVAIVPTLGVSPYLAESVATLRAQGGVVLVVAPAGLDLELRTETDDAVRVVATDGAVGFARANLEALAAAPDADYVALVNDDAVVADGWAAKLLAELESRPEAAAVQGVVLTMADDPRIDGAGLAWNGWWQAVQRGRGAPSSSDTDSKTASETASHEIFGVSATAGMYRRAALDDVAPVFDAGLDSYYEDVDLAVRLRVASWTARCVPAARARHAGSTTGGGRGAARLVRRNRYTVLARALGWRLLPRLPWLVLRDVVDAVRAVSGLDVAAAAAIASGTLSGLARLPSALLRTGSGLLRPDELRRWTP